MDFQGAVQIGLVAAEGLFGTPVPPIFNVSPSSTLRTFPRITYEQAWTLLSPARQAVSPVEIVRRWLHGGRQTAARRHDVESRPDPLAG